MRFEVTQEEARIWLSRRDVLALKRELEYAGTVCAQGIIMQALEAALEDIEEGKDGRMT